jgi:cell division septum initiation protein DivIVA
VFSVLFCGSLSGQPPRPPGPPPSPAPAASFEERLADLRRRIEQQPPVDVSAQRALQYAKRYADRAEKEKRAGREPEADRIAAAAAALLHVAEHQQHLRNGGGPRVPSPEEIKDHLQRVYFRTEQADYFLKEAHDEMAAPFPQWARDFYQLAARAYDRQEWRAADEDAKCSEDVTGALENLAQAAHVRENRPGSPPPPPAPRP